MHWLCTLAFSGLVVRSSSVLLLLRILCQSGENALLQLLLQLLGWAFLKVRETTFSLYIRKLKCCPLILHGTCLFFVAFAVFMKCTCRSPCNRATLEVNCCEKGASKWWRRIFANWVAVLTSLSTKISDAGAPFPFGGKTPAWLTKHNPLSLMLYLSGQDIQPKRDLTRFVKWPRYIRLQRQRAILYKRLKVPPAVNQFTQALDRQTGKLWFFCYLYSCKIQGYKWGEKGL